MKNILLALFMSAMGSIALAQTTLSDVHVSELCTQLEDAKLPGACQVNCIITEDPAGPKMYILALTNKNQHTTLDVISSDRAEREAQNNGTEHTFAGKKGQTPSLDLVIDPSGTVSSLFINDVDCK